MALFQFDLPGWITTVDHSETAQASMSYADRPVGAYIDGGDIRIVYPAGEDEPANEVEIGSTQSGVAGIGVHSLRLLWFKVPEFGLWPGTINVLKRDHAKVTGTKLNYRAVGHGLKQFEGSDLAIGFDAHLSRYRHYWRMHWTRREAFAAVLMTHLGYLADHYDVEPPQLIQHFHDTEGACVMNTNQEVDEAYAVRVVAKAREFAEMFKGVRRLRDAGLAAGCSRMGGLVLMGGDSQGTDMAIDIFYQGHTFNIMREDEGYSARTARGFEQSVSTISEGVEALIAERCLKSVQ